MSIIDSRDEVLETTKDVKRHHEKVKEAVRKKLPEIISEENIITSDSKGRKVRVPVKSIDIPDLRHGKRSKDGDGDGDGDGGGKAGIGQGPGKKGDVMGRRPGEKQGDGDGSKAGNQPGEDTIECEFSLEEIIEMMFDDLGLPNVQKKDLATIEVSLGYKISGSNKVGPMVLLKKRPTAKNSMKTFWVFMTLLQDKFQNRSELDCFAALKNAGGALYEAEQMLLDPLFKHDFKQVDPFPIIGNDDLRFFEVSQKKTSETNAVVFAILDVSGSMHETKKYIARAIIFWMVQVLRKQYTNIEIRFIVHHTEARLVEEKDFFRTRESGGTIGHSAFRLVNELIAQKYSTDTWNVYAFYFSDGDDFEIVESAKEMRKTIDSGINMLAFANIKDEHERIFGGFDRKDIVDHIKTEWPVSTNYVPVGLSTDENLEIVSGNNNFPFFAVTIAKKEHVFVVLREFLKKGR